MAGVRARVTRRCMLFADAKIMEIKIGSKTQFENLLKQFFHSPALDIYILLDVLLCSIAEYFYELCRIFGEPVGRVKIQTTSKNSQRYYTTKRLKNNYSPQAREYW